MHEVADGFNIFVKLSLVLSTKEVQPSLAKSPLKFSGGLAKLVLTHWGWVMHICVDNLTIIDSRNGLSPGWRQAITWTNARILLIGPIRRNFNEI